MGSAELYQLLVWSFILSAAMFSILVLLIVIFFRVSTAKLGKNKKGLIALFLFSFFTSLLFVSYQQKMIVIHAKELSIVASDLKLIDKNTYQVRFDSSEAALGTVELEKNGSITSLLPSYSLQPRVHHFINITKSDLDHATIRILLNGKKFPFTPKGLYN